MVKFRHKNSRLSFGKDHISIKWYIYSIYQMPSMAGNSWCLRMFKISNLVATNTAGNSPDVSCKIFPTVAKICLFVGRSGLELSETYSANVLRFSFYAMSCHTCTNTTVDKGGGEQHICQWQWEEARGADFWIISLKQHIFKFTSSQHFSSLRDSPDRSFRARELSLHQSQILIRAFWVCETVLATHDEPRGLLS